MPLPETYAFARPIPYLLRYGSQTIVCPIRYGATGALTPPSSGTISIRRPTGDLHTSSASVSIVGGQAQYIVTLSTSEPIGPGWTIELTPVYGSETYPTLRAEAILCDYVPPMPISVLDLYTYEPELRHRVPQSQSDRGDGTGWQPQVDDGYYALIQHLIDTGHSLWLIRGIVGAREWLRTLILMRCCRALSTTPDDAWAKKATDYRYEHERAKGQIKVQLSEDDPSTRRSARGPYRLAPSDRPLY